MFIKKDEKNNDICQFSSFSKIAKNTPEKGTPTNLKKKMYILLYTLVSLVYTLFIVYKGKRGK